MNSLYPGLATAVRFLSISALAVAITGELRAQKYTLPQDLAHQLSPTFSGSALFWEPGIMAFKVGSWDSADPSPIGVGSAAFGYGTASGNGSFAANEGLALGDDSAAFGLGGANGAYSFAAGYGASAYDLGAVAFGEGTMAIGSNSFAMGEFTMAIGNTSTAFGSWTTASNLSSTAFGDSTTASGAYSFATGIATHAEAYASFGIGRYNVGGYTITSDANYNNDGNNVWIATDPIFEIGIGTSNTARANALTVYKDGRVTVHKRQGDILMGEFGNPGD